MLNFVIGISWLYGLKILSDVNVPEKKANGDKIEEVERPTYIKLYLEDAMRCNRNMKKFNSLRALYLFEKSKIKGFRK